MTRDVSIWHALADPKRRQIIGLLQERPHTTGELASHFDVSRFAVMKHLSVLEDADLIAVRREGRTRWNALNEDKLPALRLGLNQEQEPGHLSGMPEQSWRLPPALLAAHAFEVQATPARIFHALTEGIDAWWGARHRNDSRMVLEPIVNGRFFEAFNTAEQGILLATVTRIIQDEELRLRGPLAFTERPFHAPLPDSLVRILLAPRGDATALSLSHYFCGLVDEETMAAAGRQWQALLEHGLKPFAEQGIPVQLHP